MTSAEFGSSSNRYFNSMDCDICGNHGCEWCHNKPIVFKKDYVKIETNKVEKTISKVAE